MITDEINEIWMDVLGYDGYYQISNIGRVKSLERDNTHKKYGRIIPESFLKPQEHYKNGYFSVLFKIGKHQKRFTIHSLVANAFLENPKSLKEVNHKDGVKSNNSVQNLEWCTRSENNIHAFAIGLRKKKNTLA